VPVRALGLTLRYTEGQLYLKKSEDHCMPTWKQKGIHRSFYTVKLNSDKYGRMHTGWVRLGRKKREKKLQELVNTELK
jgi:hypothetical protein